MPTLVGCLQLMKQDQDNDRGRNVCQLEENQVSCLSVVEQIQIPCDEDQEIEELRASRNASDGPVLRDGHEQDPDASKVQIVAHVAEDIPRMGRKISKMQPCMMFVVRIVMMRMKSCRSGYRCCCNRVGHRVNTVCSNRPRADPQNRLTKLFLACQNDSEVLKHVLQKGGR